MAKRDPGWAEHHRERKGASRAERRAVIRKGYEDFQHHGVHCDPPYPAGDIRRWWWQNGWETADRVRQGRAAGIEDAPEWT
jgi:hypothetical protein